jgi:hypothetical protein
MIHNHHPPRRRVQMPFRVTATFGGLELRAIEKVRTVASQLLGQLNVALRAMSYEVPTLTSVHAASRQFTAAEQPRLFGSKADNDSLRPATYRGHFYRVRRASAASLP